MKIWREEQLNLLKDYTKKVVDSINETMTILNGNCESERNIDKDLGGYIQFMDK